MRSPQNPFHGRGAGRSPTAPTRRRRARARRAIAASMLFLPILIAGAPAATVEDLYGASVDLLPAQRTASTETAQRALAAVLVKVTGLPDVSGSSLVAPVLSQAERLVQQQGFVSRGTLRYVFDEDATRETLLAAGLPYWDDDRPQVLVLLELPSALLETATTDADAGAVLGEGDAWNVRYVHGDDDREVLAALRGAAARRGLPVRVPDADWLAQLPPVNDRGAEPFPIGGEGLVPAGGDEHPGLALARRHGADLVLLGEGDRTAAGVWQVRWRLLGDAQTQPWIGGLESGPEYLADVLASRYAAYAGAGAQQVDLELIGIDSPTAYARTLAYLRRLDLVERIDVRQARAGRLLLSLDSRYEAAKLERLLQLSPLLSPASDGRLPLPNTLRVEYQAAVEDTLPPGEASAGGDGT